MLASSACHAQSSRQISLSASGSLACQHLIEGLPVQILCLCPLPSVSILDCYAGAHRSLSCHRSCSSLPVCSKISPYHHMCTLLGACLLSPIYWVYVLADSWRACHVSAVAQIHDRAAARSNNGWCSQDMIGHCLHAPWPAEDMHWIPPDLPGALGSRGGKASHVSAAHVPEKGILWPADQS